MPDECFGILQLLFSSRNSILAAFMRNFCFGLPQHLFLHDCSIHNSTSARVFVIRSVLQVVLVQLLELLLWSSTFFLTLPSKCQSNVLADVFLT